ncbi:IclR family transcriptional regulator [Sporolactobacillus sp. CQH2019]|uniref:IclR family transcriptional regulator n=1 Tax=Sporolactobacillus sp. CQH2019 TaxID=3023512 RepID=UPI0023676DA7|nr:IclR family transcriptional regulator [Sporolactobacillus sp. CQH2019]MDD9147752.1 IclR family transcriptional regulator [Sporolactobacillus sp. CQH2019]
MPEQKPYGTVILRAKQILDFLEQQSRPMNLQEIYTSLQTSKSTVLKILNTLCLVGYVKRDEGTKRYTLGIKMISYGEAARKSFSIVEFAEPYLVALNEELGETIHLGVFDHDQIVYVKKINSKGKIILRSQVGHSIDLYCSAMGKAYLAEQDKQTVLDYFHRVKLIKRSRNTITDPDRLLENLEEIRQCGYATDNEENEDEIYCIGTVIKHQGRIEGLMSVSTPVFRINEEKKKKIIALLKKARLEIESKMNA